MSVSEAARPVPNGPAPTPRGGPGGKTLRKDRWWLQPLVTVVVLVLFIAYSTWSAFNKVNYFHDPYLSPFFSPCLAASCPEQVRWASLNLMPWISPAIYILVFPLGFRMTCYYYRKAYYRSFWQSPPGCAVAEPHKKYTGETRLPLILQNLHRYFLYFAVIVNLILAYDAVLAFRFPAENGHHGGFGVGVGTAVITINAILLAMYTASCHSCRHLIGGRLNHFSKHPVRYKLWGIVSKLNPHHPKFAWISLFGVALTDVYVRLVASGTITDYHWIF
jgi:hypothetical protein